MSKKIYDSLTELVGNTPLVRLHGYEKKLGLKAKLLAKVEYFNPIGSIKDRIVLRIIEDAEREGKIKPGKMADVLLFHEASFPFAYREKCQMGIHLICPFLRQQQVFSF
ncbi:MAG: pyridoxal-phosphate dependent enzyme, partial [Spirochaetaceae bacterium]|nr:pyridoxal-phosphate dependent enzyme [Spirochaetaceae bacterium]